MRIGVLPREHSYPEQRNTAPISEPANGAGASHHEVEKILIVDDNEAGRYALARVLRQGGYKPLEAGTAEEGLRLISEAHPNLVLLDIKLPDANGIDICRQLKRDPQTENLPVIQTSSLFISSRDRVIGFESGADAYLAAPFDPAEVLAQVKALLRIREAESALRRSEAALRETSERFRAVLEQSLDVCYRRDLRLDRYDYMSPVCEQVLGYTVEQMNQMSTLEVLNHVHPDDRLHVQNAFKRAVAEGTGRLEYRWLHSDGQCRWVADSVRILKDAAGESAYCSGVVRDITERKTASLRLAENEQKLRIALEAAQLGTWVYDLQTNDWELDARAQVLYGLETSQNVHDEALMRLMLHPDDIPKMWAAVQKASDPQGSGLYEMEYRTRKRDGSYRWLTAWGQVEFVNRDGTKVPLRMVGTSRDVTAKKRADEALRHATIFLQAISDHTDEVIFAKDRQGRLTYANPATLKLVGKTMEDTLGKTDLELLHDKQAAEQVMRNDQRIMSSGVAEDLEELVAGPDGTPHIWASRKTPYLGSEGEVIGLLGISRDVTSHKLAERELAETRARLEMALTAGDVATWVWDIRADRIYPDHNLERLFSMRDEVRAKGALEAYMQAVHPEDRERVVALVRDAIAQGHTYEAEYRVTTATGDIRWVFARGKIERDAAGEAVRMPGLALDVTARRKAEAALRQSEEQFHILADSIPNLAWSAAPDGTITWFNRRWYDYTGTTPEQMRDQGWHRVLDPEILPEVLKQWRHAVATGEPLEMEFPLRGADGSFRWFLTRVMPLKDPSGRVVRWFGTNTDISEPRQAREILTRSKHQLEQLVAERTAKLQELVHELEHFSYTIVHDMRAPLRAMRGFADMVGEYCECDKKEPKEFLRRIAVSADRMDNLITDALNYNKAVRQELPLEPVDTGALLRGMLDSYPELQPSRADVAVETEIPAVMGNKAGLTQCFSNLLGNAVKFVEPGKLSIVRVSAEMRDGWVRIWIKDNGIGISKSMLPRLFHMFTRGQNKYEGTGIGLALVRKVVDRMGGRLGVDSEEGQGSQFWLELRPAPIPPER